MRGKWILISVAAVLAGAGLGALSLHWKGRTVAPARKSGAALIEASPEVALRGNLRPQHVVAVKPEIAGDIDSLIVDVGEDVFAGEVLAQVGSAGLEDQRNEAAKAVADAQDLSARAESNVATARLESSRAEADRQRARTALDKARAVFDRQETLHKAGATPRLTWEKAQRDLQSAQQEYDAMEKAARSAAEQQQSAVDALAAAQKTVTERSEALSAARNNVQSGEVRSPVDGTVVSRNGEIGKPAGDEIFEIATDLFALEVSVDAEPGVLQRLRPGEAAMVSIPDLQNAGFAGQIREIKDGKVTVEFNCTLQGVRPGMPVEVRLRLQ